MPEPVQATAEDAKLQEEQIAAEEQAENAAEADAEQGDNEKERDGGKRKSGYRRQKDKIARLEQELEVWRSAALNPRSQAEESPKAQATQTDDQPPIKPVRPKQTEFDNWDKYEAAVAKWEEDRDIYFEKLAEYKARTISAQERQKREQQAEFQKTADGWATQVANAKQKYDDFEEIAFSASVPMTPAMQEAIVTSAYGADIAYELGSNPEEAERIAHLSPMAAGRAIGVIEARIAGKDKAAEEEAEEKEKPTPPQTKAPPPPTPIRKTTSASTEPRDDEPYKDWLRKREAQIKRN